MKMSSSQGEFVFLILGIMKLVHGDNCFDVDSVVEHEKYMEHQVFRKFWSPSLYDCASECLMSSACASFGFDKKTHTCFLNTNSSEAGNVVDRTGFLFSDIQQWPKVGAHSLLFSLITGHLVSRARSCCHTGNLIFPQWQCLQYLSPKGGFRC